MQMFSNTRAAVRLTLAAAMFAAVAPLAASDTEAKVIRSGARTVGRALVNRTQAPAEAPAASKSTEDATAPVTGSGETPIAKAQTITPVVVEKKPIEVPGCATGQICIVCLAGCPTGTDSIVHAHRAPNGAKAP
jgi:hypothetical protein